MLKKIVGLALIIAIIVAALFLLENCDATGSGNTPLSSHRHILGPLS